MTTLLVNFFNWNNAPWCAMFAHWLWLKSGVKGRTNTSYASTWGNYKELPVCKYEPEDARISDFILFKKSHTGMVIFNDVVFKTIF